MPRGTRFHSLLSKAELFGEEIPLCDLLDKAVTQLESFEGPIDAIIGFWDFPVSSMVPVLCRKYGYLRESGGGGEVRAQVLEPP